ncbi:MAG: flagellar export protein FliJ [Verrucomicrobia bacterium]|nr:flagellar export protein FliJ [Verrucomicrobiota bacterium]
MKPFRFSLQAVLTIRQNQERKALEAFALAQRAFAEAEARLQAIRSEIDELHGARRDVFVRSVSSESLQVMQHGLRALQNRIPAAQEQVEKARGVAVRRSAELLEARKQREVVEKLYDKRRAAHAVDAGRAEQKALDEFASYKSAGGLAMKWQ